jgi:hypothetical protein
MKRKKFDNRLSLNKKTVAHLDNGEKSRVRGGLLPSDPRVCPCTATWQYTNLGCAPKTIICTEFCSA